jgi:hypothetical protein
LFSRFDLHEEFFGVRRSAMAVEDQENDCDPGPEEVENALEKTALASRLKPDNQDMDKGWLEEDDIEDT